MPDVPLQPKERQEGAEHDGPEAARVLPRGPAERHPAVSGGRAAGPVLGLACARRGGRARALDHDRDLPLAARPMVTRRRTRRLLGVVACRRLLTSRPLEFITSFPTTGGLAGRPLVTARKHIPEFLRKEVRV